MCNTHTCEEGFFRYELASPLGSVTAEKDKLHIVYRLIYY